MSVLNGWLIVCFFCFLYCSVCFLVFSFVFVGLARVFFNRRPCVSGGSAPASVPRHPNTRAASPASRRTASGAPPGCGTPRGTESQRQARSLKEMRKNRCEMRYEINQYQKFVIIFCFFAVLRTSMNLWNSNMSLYSNHSQTDLSAYQWSHQSVWWLHPAAQQTSHSTISGSAKHRLDGIVGYGWSIAHACKDREHRTDDLLFCPQSFLAKWKNSLRVKMGFQWFS